MMMDSYMVAAIDADELFIERIASVDEEHLVVNLYKGLLNGTWKTFTYSKWCKCHKGLWFEGNKRRLDISTDKFTDTTTEYQGFHLIQFRNVLWLDFISHIVVYCFQWTNLMNWRSKIFWVILYCPQQAYMRWTSSYS